MRERPGVEDGVAAEAGITPARAGKTVKDPHIDALSLLTTFKIYLTSLPGV